MRRAAQFDATGSYRYSLTREWAAGHRVAFVLLNPSTADHTQDDPTLRRCIGFAQAWGYGALEVVNLFAYRATRPAALRAAAEPVGPENDRFLRAAQRRAQAVVLAWGIHGVWRGRDQAVLRLFRAGRMPVQCLGLTRDGHPRHVLYLPRGLTARPFVPPAG